MFFNIIAYIVSLPARWRGIKVGNSFIIGPGYSIWNKRNNITIGNKVIIGRNASLLTYKQGKIIIKDQCNIGKDVTISAVKKIIIGKKCLIGYGVSFLDHDHNLTNSNRFPVEAGLTKGQEIIIEDGCFIGAHSFILKGVHLGKRCVVGANSVVTKSFPANSSLTGNPAKKISKKTV